MEFSEIADLPDDEWEEAEDQLVREELMRLDSCRNRLSKRNDQDQ